MEELRSGHYCTSTAFHSLHGGSKPPSCAKDSKHTSRRMGMPTLWLGGRQKLMLPKLQGGLIGASYELEVVQMHLRSTMALYLN